MHVTVYIISPWSRNAEGNIAELTQDAIANGWRAVIEDVTDQPGTEIRLGHSVLVEVQCAPETLEMITKSAKYTIIESKGEISDEERVRLSKHVAEVQQLPRRATREVARQLLVERFREQGSRDILKEAARDAFREMAGNSASN